ncbi:MAG TPA: FxLYD domain-containing protein [Candidatus Acidoferrales bacterium]|nr:FxLYD domain-containing protein [Candidatus Acidoferrales bacterium]
MGGPFLVGLVVVIVVFGAFYLAMRFSGGSTPTAQKPLAFGAAEQAYVQEIKFQNLSLSGFENMLHQQVTYLNGDISNAGSRTIQGAEVTVEFYDQNGKVALRDTRRIIGNGTRPLESGETRDFQLGFEAIPNGWNHKFPEIHITGLDLE